MKERRRGTHLFVTLLTLFCLILGGGVLQKPQKALADSDAIQVNGKYTITSRKLVTKCKLETADATLKKKIRTYKITSKTKIQIVNDDFTKKTLKGKKRKNMIKRLNKKNLTIQFKVKKGKLKLIWIL